MQRKLNQIEMLNQDRDSKQQIVVPKLRPKSTRDRDNLNQIYNYNLAVQIVLKDRDNLNQIYNYNPKDRDINYSKTIPTNFKIKIVVPNLKDRDSKNQNQIYNYKLTSSVGLDVKKMFYQIIKRFLKKPFRNPRESLTFFVCNTGATAPDKTLFIRKYIYFLYLEIC